MYHTHELIQASSTATVSTWLVCGNISHACTEITRYGCPLSILTGNEPVAATRFPFPPFLNECCGCCPVAPMQSRCKSRDCVVTLQLTYTIRRAPHERRYAISAADIPVLPGSAGHRKFASKSAKFYHCWTHQVLVSMTCMCSVIPACVELSNVKHQISVKGILLSFMVLNFKDVVQGKSMI